MAWNRDVRVRGDAAGVPSPLPITRPARWIIAAVLPLCALLALPVTANAAKQRWVGTIASDLGGFVRIKVRLRFVNATTAVGTLKCRRGSLRCIAKRGSFEAVITLANGVRCAAAGPATSSSMVGDYACLSGTRLVDAGVLVLNRRH